MNRSENRYNFFFLFRFLGGTGEGRGLSTTVGNQQPLALLAAAMGGLNEVAVGREGRTLT